jgi:uncharacterized protein YraI
MLKLNTLFVALVFLLVITACTPAVVETPTPAPIMTEEPIIPVTGIAVVQSVEIQILESQPLQVNAILRGQLPDAGCTTISKIDQVREGNVFKLTLTTTTDPRALCAQALTPFEQVVSLNVDGLAPAQYTVEVSGIEQTFELLSGDINAFNQKLVDTLNKRDYETLKTMMHDSFMLAYWRSEGTAYAPDQAVEQLRTNLISSALPITADANKDLAALLGADPVTIVGPNAVDVKPLFISGLGSQGKDEAVLFSAKLSDGKPYWYGMLFAKDGFVESGNLVIQPVDYNAYPTSVKYVLAKEDVRMRSGPGTQFAVIGFVAAGQTARVTGVSADGNWWRVICPDGSTGSCWVSSARNLTVPTDGIVVTPFPDQTAYPTNVKFVMAEQDVTIYSGPGTQFKSVGFIAAGQTAKVTGVNSDGKWWRVICPDDSVGNCWVSANTRFTRPVDQVTSLADVQSVEVQILESYPVQVNVIARGQLPDAGCTTISGATQSRTGNTFNITLSTRTDPLALCAQALTPFEYVIALDISSLLPGRYLVRVNNVQASFELSDAVVQTDIEYVMAQRDISIFSGPSEQYGVIGFVANGQIARVTGMNSNGTWWRVICPDDTVGSCWVTANPAYTLPTQLP